MEWPGSALGRSRGYSATPFSLRMVHTFSGADLAAVQAGAEINLVADPARLRQLDLGVLNE